MSWLPLRCKNCNELLATFDLLWTNGNEERLENKKSIEKTLEQKEIEIALGKNETENVK